MWTDYEKSEFLIGNDAIGEQPFEVIDFELIDGDPSQVPHFGFAYVRVACDRLDCAIE
jgi:hypothetical protein